MSPKRQIFVAGDQWPPLRYKLPNSKKPAAKTRGGQPQSNICRDGRPWPREILAGKGELCLGSQRGCTAMQATAIQATAIQATAIQATAIQATAMHCRLVIHHRSRVIHCRAVIDHRLAGT